MTLRLSLVIDGNASGAKNAANETRQAISALAKESDSANAALQKTFSDLARTASGSLASIGNVRLSLAALADGNSTAAVNARLGVWNDFGGASRQNDILAYGKQLDDLRAKYNPLFAAGQQYKEALSGINDAARVGAISEIERAAALARTKEAFASQVSVIRGVADAHGGLSSQAMAASHSLRSAAEGLALGFSPSQILLGQLNHLSYAASGKDGISGAFKEAGAALAGFITPTTAVIGGLAAVGAAGYLTLASIKQTEKEFGELSARTNETVQSLHALEAAAAFKGIATPDFLKGLEHLGDLSNDAEHGLGSLATLFRANGVAAGSLNDNLLRGADLIRNAGSEAEKYRLIQQLGLPATREWVQYLSQGSDGLRQAAQGAVQFGGLADENMIRKAREFDEAWDTGWKNFMTSGKAAVLGIKGGLDDLIRWSNHLGQDWHPGMLGLRIGNALADTGDFSNRQLQTALDKEAAKRRNGGSNTVNPEEQARLLTLEQQRIGVLGNLATIQETVRQSEINISQARLAGVNITQAEEARIRAYAEAQALGTLAIRQQTDAARIEADLAGRGLAATAAFRAEQERLADFRLRGIALTKEQAAALHSEALALGEATQAAALARLRSDLAFERSQIGRSADEQQVASRLRGIYNDKYQAHNDDPLARDLRSNQQLAFVHDGGLDVIKDFNSELRNTKNIGEAATAALDRGLAKVEDRLLEMVYNDWFNKAFGGKSSGVSPLSLLGLGGGGSPLSLTDSGGGFSLGSPGGTGGGLGGLYDIGGYTGNGGIHEVAGVVHGREFVMDAETTRIIGPANLEAWRRSVRGYEGGGYVGPPVLPAAWRGGQGGGDGVTVNVHPPAGVTTTAKKSRNANGSSRIDLYQIAKDAAVDAYRRGDMDAINRVHYGLQPSLIDRP